MVIDKKQSDQTRENPDPEIDRILAKNYLMTAGKVERLNAGLFRVLDVRTGQRYIFKRHLLLYPENLTPLTQIYRLAGERGFSPKMIPTRSGELIGTTGSTYFSLQEFVNGEAPDGINAQRLAVRLAALHRFLCENRFAPLVNHLFRMVTNMRTTACRYGYEKLVPMICDVEDLCLKSPRQIIHGDLHPGNILNNADGILFIDFDSATFHTTGMDVAFCAFRCTGSNTDKIYRFVDRYNHSNPPERVGKAHIWKFLAYAVVQRILFILIEKDQGRTQWLADLDNQQRYLSTVLDIVHAEI